MTIPQTSQHWQPDVLGDGYEHRVLPLGTDPDGEGEIQATLVRHHPAELNPTQTPAVLYVHGFTDYFFQKHIAEFFAARGDSFYALDLRKCGRSLRTGQTPHFVSDLALYDTELDEAVRLIRAETNGQILVMAHSTGGLVVPLWLDRVNRRPTGTAGAGIVGAVLNSPWFDLQGPAYFRGVGTAVVGGVGRVRARSAIPLRKTDSYGSSLHTEAYGEWDFDVNWKPLTGFPIRFGWLRAVRRGHARLHKGLSIGVPALILRSEITRFSSRYRPEVDMADAVLDVKQIQRWAGCLGERTMIIPIPNARHDVFLSAAEPRAQAFDELAHWLEWLTAATTP